MPKHNNCKRCGKPSGVREYCLPCERHRGIEFVGKQFDELMDLRKEVAELKETIEDYKNQIRAIAEIAQGAI